MGWFGYQDETAGATRLQEPAEWRGRRVAERSGVGEALGWFEVYTRGQRESPGGSGEGAEVAAEAIGIDVAEEGFEVLAGAFPDGNGTGEEGFTLKSEVQEAAAAVGGVGRDFEKAAALERFESSGESGAVHAEEVGDGSHTGRVGAVEGHEEGKLTIVEFDGTKCVVEATS